MNIEVTQKADGWMLGTIEGGYEWQAKVYEKPSEFGINGGRVSKLFIRPVGLGWQPALISYDRGWDKRPETQDAKGAFVMIKNHLSRILGERRWTRAKLARLTGIRPSTIGDLYNEMADRVSFDQLDRICEVLDCSISDLLEYIPNQQRRTGKDLILEEHGNRKKKQP